jgi:hypothetical protein
MMKGEEVMDDEDQKPPSRTNGGLHDMYCLMQPGSHASV